LIQIKRNTDLRLNFRWNSPCIQQATKRRAGMGHWAFCF